MDVNPDVFFREAALRICGSLEIEKALYNCFTYLAELMPAARMGLHVYDYGLGQVDTIALADREGGRLVNIRTQLPPDIRKKVLDEWRVGVTVIDRLEDNAITRLPARAFGAQDEACVVMELILEGRELGMLTVFFPRDRKPTAGHAALLSLLNELFALALTNSLRFRELGARQEQLAEDNRLLKARIRGLADLEVIGAGNGLREVMDMARLVAERNSPVILLGETGTGKELIAQVIHLMSSRGDGPFIRVNCGAIPETLVDSELFGHEKGAFTGAMTLKRGRFEQAHAGTIFLDEIGELPLEAQVRLLRVLQEKEIDRVGGSRPIKVDIRVIAATHRNLEDMLSRGLFRPDLYYRLRVFPIGIPPLRERPHDIPALLFYFLNRKAREMNLPDVPTLAHGALDRLTAYPWPGNVRELANTVERALILSRGRPLEFPELETRSPAPDLSGPIVGAEAFPPLDRVMAGHIGRALGLARGKVEGRGGAAELLGVNPRTLRHRMKKLGVPFGRKTKPREGKTGTPKAGSG
ncbi:MAG: sigma 54-interacting transcriptional regulator [Pseudomonadota bacterium]